MTAWLQKWYQLRAMVKPTPKRQPPSRQGRRNFTLRLPHHLLEFLDELAAETGVSRTKQLEQLLQLMWSAEQDLKSGGGMLFREIGSQVLARSVMQERVQVREASKVAAGKLVGAVRRRAGH